MQIANFIDGKFVPPRSGAYFDDINPATAEVIAAIPDSDERDVDDAVRAAKAAFPAWSRTSTAERSNLLLKLADLIEKNLDELARIESIDNGKTISLAKRLDIPRAVANFRFFATAILHQSSDAHVMDAAALNYTLRQPLGVVGLISPWNLPLYLLSWKIAPAIAAGNTCVAKPSELTPLTANRLAELSIEAGIPPGVINIVHGYGNKAGRALTCHDDVAAISFTGGTITGAAVAANAAPRFKKLSLELGGKNPNLIFADADLDDAIATSIRSSFWNQGEICLCGSRIFVERSIHDEFVTRFADAAKKLRIGDPLDEATDVGALISEAHLQKVMGYIDLATTEGGTIVAGGRRVERPGYFVEPTIITGLGCDCRVLQEEIFGPVVTITPFDSEDEAVAFANSTRYGLSATVWTRDLSRAHRVAATLDAGTIWINCWLLRDLRVPFGGMKESGVGREGGFESLNFFTEAKNVCVKI
ncbi:MAG: aminomuconate-semialdehyde/2-hydroxymuconate-6-semialdehyde dehydrogenase [Thermoanaerobaculia bacterium]|jgi:aminomuconate-semialdehyde/2-hydroxymuconate-6-semialdehyde dehydrogenase|nr:aminomuconate-semialdehyde/2-hydroxymuconate-6-semialdehyde dehydrogenase [Thermoanaerobaculia bacterium]